MQTLKDAWATIPTADRRSLMDHVRAGVRRAEHTCELSECGATFTARTGARFCSPKHRSLAHWRAKRKQAA